ncbi:unnamed protein product [Danaus chrysippus]|uniref:(African queen) hypothetical protein n=1 Tax=Danaus chrysippus TaxID=151541 RepID=A0A8J2QYY2_9NEOP|nr:unnamed protein product [Danaus chrysippus]
MENLFIVFDPSYLSFVWPKIKNGVHLNLGYHCWEDVSVFLKDLAEGRAWAYKAADASGRYQSGLFSGRRFWLGSKEQCLQLDDSYTSQNNETWGEFYNGDYLNTLMRREKFGGNVAEWSSLVQRDELMRKMVRSDNEAAVSLAYTALQIDLNVTKITMLKSYKITLGLCLPRSCVPQDVVSIINFSIMLNDNLKTNKTVSRTIKITSLRHVDSFYDIRTDCGAVSLLMVTVTLIIIAIIATIIDFELIKFKPYVKTSSFDLEQYNDKENRNGHHINQYSKQTHRIDEKLSANLNEIKRAMREKGIPPSVTLDVMTQARVEGITSCKRCGKYKKQCPNLTKQNLEACPTVKYNSSASLTTEYKMENTVCKNLLLSFSFKHSWARIFNTNLANKNLALVHAMKITAVLWIVLVHVTAVVWYNADNSMDINDDNTMFYLLCSGTLAFDLLFFVSGVFSSQHFFYLKSRYSAQELVSLGGVCGEMLQLICFITNRAVRLLPPYLFTIFLTSVLARVSRDTAVLSTPERDYDTCDSYWWRNILYLNNLYPQQEQCMQVSWYLSSETQLHGVMSLACLLVALHRRRAAALLMLMVVLTAVTVDVTRAISDVGQRVWSSFSLYSLIVSRPWGGVPSYCLGALVGWLLHVTEGRCTVNRTTSVCLWSSSVLCVISSLLVSGRDPRWTAAVHLAWPVGLVWPVLAGATTYSDVTRGLVSSPLVSGVSRLCYTTLVCHGAVCRALLLSADTALCSDVSCLFCYFAGCTLVSLCASLCLSLLVEMPSCCLLRRISDYTYR